MMGWGGYGYEGWGWWGAHMLSSLLFWVLAIGAVVFLVRWLMASQHPEAGPRAQTALDILKKRYARGEVEREEFELKRRDLQA